MVAPTTMDGWLHQSESFLFTPDRQRLQSPPLT